METPGAVSMKVSMGGCFEEDPQGSHLMFERLLPELFVAVFAGVLGSRVLTKLTGRAFRQIQAHTTENTLLTERVGPNKVIGVTSAIELWNISAVESA